ncbi:phenoloxidase-activating factor 2-like [Hetaerina americana]|uniref:phenoloxidase-activating factor 2-like n=1 Tax=Hetaerina americana TaxID=62018 RepID=UPI003A7F378F
MMLASSVRATALGALFFCALWSDVSDVCAAEGQNENGCDCMEYWKCVMSGGTPYSYCGLSDSSVCCFFSGIGGAGGGGGSGAVGGGSQSLGVGLLTGTLVTLDRPPSSAGRQGCGVKGGEAPESDGVAEFGEWRWHAAILEKPDDLYICGASLFRDNWVITAAHCIDDYALQGNITKVLKVRLGEHDVTRGDEGNDPYQELDVQTAFIYPGFNNRSLVHDIALLQLKGPVKRRSNVGVVCLPRPNEFGGQDDWAPNRGTSDAKCYITGWGRRSETSDHSVVLKEVRVPLWSQTACQGALKDQFGNGYFLPNSSICAGALGRDACDGDGGGPLSCERNGAWWQIGIVSFGIGCGRRNTPGVYTRVDKYYDWIIEKIQIDKRLVT